MRALYHWVDSMLALRAVLAYVSMFLANETTRIFGSSYKKVSKQQPNLILMNTEEPQMLGHIFKIYRQTLPSSKGLGQWESE